jgi:hypothetical protein
MHPEMEKYFREKMLPELYSRMKEEHGNEMVPYVQYTERGDIKAITGFEEEAYYSTGYSALFNSFGFMTETLVYKPYHDRVIGTLQFITELVRFGSQNSKEILKLRSDANRHLLAAKEYVLDWEQDTTRWDEIQYHGYSYDQTTTPSPAENQVSTTMKSPILKPSGTTTTSGRPSQSPCPMPT